MKRVAAAAVLLVLALGVSLYGRFLTEHSTDEIIGTMQHIDVLLEENDTAAALELSEKFQKRWEKLHRRLCLFLQHEELDPLENTFAVLPYYIRADSIDRARAECRLVISVTEHIELTERINFENIL